MYYYDFNDLFIVKVKKLPKKYQDIPDKIKVETSPKTGINPSKGSRPNLNLVPGILNWESNNLAVRSSHQRSLYSFLLSSIIL